jgi:predicted acylesterase/phospholipase RssA
MSLTDPSKKSHRALILPGAVSKGAYEAGVISILAEKDVRIDRIVATSSGALNGVAYAAGIRAGCEKEMAEKLTRAWIELGSWHDALRFSPLDLITGKGLSKRDGLLKMLNSLVIPCSHSKKREVELRIIVASLNGIRGAIGAKPASTYEKVIHFSGADFDTAEGLERIFNATTAACAFPGLFSPVEIEGLGPCFDGGTVNNAPIAYALDEGDISEVIVPVPFTELLPKPVLPRGFRLLNHLVNILINERLYRDLKDAEAVNSTVAALNTLVSSGVLSSAQLQAVNAILHIRKVKITQIRPAQNLGGTVFSGFFHQAERKKYVHEGRKAAIKSLGLDLDLKPEKPTS